MSDMYNTAAMSRDETAANHLMQIKRLAAEKCATEEAPYRWLCHHLMEIACSHNRYPFSDLKHSKACDIYIIKNSNLALVVDNYRDEIFGIMPYTTPPDAVIQENVSKISNGEYSFDQILNFSVEYSATGKSPNADTYDKRYLTIDAALTSCQTKSVEQLLLDDGMGIMKKLTRQIYLGEKFNIGIILQKIRDIDKHTYKSFSSALADVNERYFRAVRNSLCDLLHNVPDSLFEPKYLEVEGGGRILLQPISSKEFAITYDNDDVSANDSLVIIVGNHEFDFPERNVRIFKANRRGSDIATMDPVEQLMELSNRRLGSASKSANELIKLYSSNMSEIDGSKQEIDENYTNFSLLGKLESIIIGVRCIFNDHTTTIRKM